MILGQVLSGDKVVAKPKSIGLLLPRSMSLSCPWVKACGILKSDPSVRIFSGCDRSVALRRI